MKKDLKIGEKAYPADNSYSVCLSTGKPAGFEIHNQKHGLAGDYQTNAVEVTIKSEPFDIAILDRFVKDKKLTYYSFVIVEYSGLQYMVLNKFHNSYEDMRTAKAMMHSMMDTDYPERL